MDHAKQPRMHAMALVIRNLGQKLKKKVAKGSTTARIDRCVRAEAVRQLIYIKLTKLVYQNKISTFFFLPSCLGNDIIRH